MNNWAAINKNRIREGDYASRDIDGFNGMFTFVINQEYLRVIISDGLGWKHVSVSRIDKPKVVPTWAMMCAIKDIFFEPEDWVMQFHPAQSEYVNNHAGCLHLWKPDAPFPVPNSMMVGIK